MISHLEQQNYDAALQYAQESAALMRGTSGENNLSFADMLNKLSVCHFYKGDYAKSEYYSLKEVELREGLRATDDTRYLTCLENASIICRKRGSYDEALKQIKKARKIAQKVHGTQSYAYANILSSYAGVYHEMGSSVNDMVYLRQASNYLDMAEAIYASLGERSLQAMIVNRSNQAAFHNNTGNAPRAESLLADVVKRCRDEYGTYGIPYATALNNLAVFYYNSGNYKLAEKYLVESIEILKSSTYEQPLQTAVCMSNLGVLYCDMGSYEIAAGLLAESQRSLETKSLGYSPAYAVVMNNLAAACLMEEYFASPENKSMERMNESGMMLAKADSIHRINCLLPHPDGNVILGNLAVWYNLTGNERKSVQMMYDQTFETNSSLKLVAMMNKMCFTGVIPVHEDQDVHNVLEPLMIPSRIKLSELLIASSMAINNTGDVDAATSFLLELVLGKANHLNNRVRSYFA